MRIRCYLNITEKEAQLLDETLKNTPFASRKDFITACIHVFLYGKNLPQLDTSTGEWLIKIRNAAVEKEKLKEEFFELLHEIALPILAMRGRKTVLNLLEEDLTSEMIARYEMTPRPDEMEEWIRQFEDIHMPEIIAHRSDVLKTHYFGGNENDTA